MFTLKKYLLHCLVILAMSSCGDSKKNENTSLTKDTSASNDLYRDPKNYFKDCKRLFASAQTQDSILYTQTEVNKDIANKAIKAFTDYAYYCGSDSLSPIFLIKTAQIAAAVNNYSQAKIVLEKCISDYPKFEGMPAALFLLGQLYDEETYLNNEEEARRLYQQIIDQYPNCAEVESAKGALKFIGMTDKEVMRELKKQAVQNKGSNVSIQ